MRNNITVKVFDEERYGKDWPPEDAKGFIEWFQNQLSVIPEEFLSTAQIEVDSVGGYENSHYATIKITYARPETDAEVSDRLAREKRKDKNRRAEELRRLAELKEKYE